MLNQNAWQIWLEVSILVDNALGLANLASLDCANSIANAVDRNAARIALVSSIHRQLKEAARQLSEIEPRDANGRIPA